MTNMNPNSDATAQANPGSAADPQFAQASVDKFEAAFDKAAEVAHGNVQALDASTSAFKTSAADLQMKVLEIAQANFGAAFGFTRELLKVSEPMAMFKLQQNFMQERMQVLSTQAREIQSLTMALMSETAKPVQEGLSKGFGAFTKAA